MNKYISLGYLANVAKYRKLGYHVIYITRYLPKGKNIFDDKISSELQWLTKLAPSRELLGDIKMGKITFNQYTPRFYSEMDSNLGPGWVQKLYYGLRDMSKSVGKPIALICYCKDLTQCHRGLLAKKLNEVEEIKEDGQIEEIQCN